MSHLDICPVDALLGHSELRFFELRDKLLLVALELLQFLLQFLGLSDRFRSHLNFCNTIRLREKLAKIPIYLFNFLQ
jgi:hypothetical protein